MGCITAHMYALHCMFIGYSYRVAHARWHHSLGLYESETEPLTIVFTSVAWGTASGLLLQ